MKRKDKIIRLLKIAMESDPKIVTFDFDGTLAEIESDDDYGMFTSGPNSTVIQKLQGHYNSGDIVCIVTSRIENAESAKKQIYGVPQDVKSCAIEWGIYNLLGSKDRDIPKITFTNGQLKDTTLRKLGSTIHYENDLEEIDKINESPGIQTIPIGEAAKF
jgi:hypothetical protein